MSRQIYAYNSLLCTHYPVSNLHPINKSKQLLSNFCRRKRNYINLPSLKEANTNSVSPKCISIKGNNLFSDKISRIYPLRNSFRSNRKKQYVLSVTTNNAKFNLSEKLKKIINNKLNDKEITSERFINNESPKRLHKQICYNLLGRSLKYSPRNFISNKISNNAIKDFFLSTSKCSLYFIIINSIENTLYLNKSVRLKSYIMKNSIRKIKMNSKDLAVSKKILSEKSSIMKAMHNEKSFDRISISPWNNKIEEECY